MKRVGFFIGLVLIGVLVSGCGRAKIYDVPQQEINSKKKHITKEDVHDAIKNAGTILGWEIEDFTDDILKGTLSLRQHVAMVTIKYSANDYSITYLGSSGLHYKNNYTIHKNYNGWIMNLDKAIKTNLDNL